MESQVPFIRSNDNRSDAPLYLSDLISIGYSSLSRDEGTGNLDIFRQLADALKQLNKNSYLDSDDITKSIVILKLLIHLREKIIATDEVPNSQVPNIHTCADSLNELLIKSAQTAIKMGDQNLITKQCEAFLKAADEIRNEQEIRGLGILNGPLKNAIGRLRKKSTIQSVFHNPENDVFEDFKDNAEIIFETGSLKEMGTKLLEMKDISKNKQDNFSQTHRFLKYMGRYEKRFLSKIKHRMNQINKKNKNTSIYNIYENKEDLLNLCSLEAYHQKRGLTLTIKKMAKNIQKLKIDPIEFQLTKTIKILEEKSTQQDWNQYTILYDATYKEREIFTDSFYDYGLKGLSPLDAISLLEEKKNKFKALDFDHFSYIYFEQEIEKLFDLLIKAFKNIQS